MSGKRFDGCAAILGAGVEQVPSIQTARSLGLSVLAVDRNPLAPGLALADHALEFDPSDRDAVVQVCRKHAVRLLIPAPTGALLKVAGHVNETLNLPGLRSAAAEACTDKLRMRQLLLAAGLPQPEFEEVACTDDMVQAAAGMRWPVILKPRFGSGSHGVVVVSGPDDLQRHMEWHNLYASRGSGSASTMIEKWVPGPEFGMDAAMVGGRFHVLCVRRKEVTPLPFRLALGVTTPPELSPGECALLAQVSERACRAIGLDDCLVHVDIVLHESTGEAFVIELSGRPSGFRISALFVPHVTGINPVLEMLLHMLGATPDFAPRLSKAGVMRMLQVPEGRITAVQGLDAARRVKNIVDAECPLGPGDVIRRADSGSSVLGNGNILSVADTLQEAKAACDEAFRCFKFTVDSQP